MQWYPNVLFWAENSSPPGKSLSSDSNNRCYCQILGLLSVELKFESLFEIQSSETQQTWIQRSIQFRVLILRLHITWRLIFQSFWTRFLHVLMCIRLCAHKASILFMRDYEFWKVQESWSKKILSTSNCFCSYKAYILVSILKS